MSDSDHHNSFLEAYDEYHDPIFRFCLIKVRNRDVALDITQDTFTKTWEYLSGGKTVENMRAFLYQVARNLIIDNSRKKKSYSLDEILESGSDFGVDETERFENKIDGAQAINVLDMLKKKDRDVLIMRYVEDVPVPEIAEIMGERENTISVRMHRALKKAEKLINDLNNQNRE